MSGSDSRSPSEAAPSVGESADEDVPFADSPLLVYVIPFAGALLVAGGIAAGVVGAYAPVQDELGLCGSPTIHVSSPGETADLVGNGGGGSGDGGGGSGEGGGGDGGGPSVDRLAFDDLTAAEQRAFEAALSDPFGEGAVRGSFANRAAFERGVVIRYEGTERYAALTSADECTSVDPLLFPLGVAAILLGVVWILAPPMYRRFAALERGG